MINDPALLKRLGKYIFAYWKEFLSSIILLLLSTVLMLAGPYLTKIAIDDYIVFGDFQGLNTIVLMYLFSLLLLFVVNSGRVYLMNLAGQKVVFALRTDLFSHLGKLSLRFYESRPTGKLVSTMINDVEASSEMFTSGIIVIFGDFFYIVIIAGIMFSMNYHLALVVFSLMPVLLFATALYRKKARNIYRKIRGNVADINASLQENIAGMTTVQLFCREARNNEEFDRMNRKNLDESLINVRYNALFFPLIGLTKFVTIGLLIWFGGVKVMKGGMQIGVLVAFILYTNRLFFPIRDFAEKFDIFQSALASLERIFKLFDIDDRIVTKEPTIRKIDIVGKIEFKDVWFSYNKEEYALKNITFDLSPGESLAIIGVTGSGKTSLINVLTRFYDIQKGVILLDGKDIKQIDTAVLRNAMSVISQDAFLFSGTCEQNIGLEDDKISKEDIVQAAQYVLADQFINGFSDKYEHELHERGKGISMGQRQLIAFARALAFDPTILIMDEATSNIDTQTEYLITEAIKRLIKGRTSIIIAHRLSTIQEVDKVLIIENGTIKEFGRREDLLKQKGVFYDLMQVGPARFFTSTISG